MNPKVDAFIGRAKQWKDEFVKLREIILSCQLTEELKWGQPCYTFQDSNIVLIHGFKDYCAILFHKGALLKDAKGILIQQTENVQSARQVRFTGVKEIVKLEKALKAYILEAIEVEKAGLKVEFKKTADFKVPEEFQTRLDSDPALKAAFEALTPGRQKAYLFYFSGAKQAKTREARVEKCVPKILDGLGMDDD
ncbi:MAG: YdeI family protein [Spirochaetota bacterium]